LTIYSVICFNNTVARNFWKVPTFQKCMNKKEKPFRQVETAFLQMDLKIIHSS
jgi:hypothetical protein